MTSWEEFLIITVTLNAVIPRSEGVILSDVGIS